MKIFIIFIIILKNESAKAKLNCFMNNNMTALEEQSFYIKANIRIFTETFMMYCKNDLSPSSSSSSKSEKIKIRYSVDRLIGFDINKCKLVITNANSSYLDFTIYFRFVYFDFYKINASKNIYRQLNVSSSVDLLQSYHNVDKNLLHINHSLSLQLYETFESIFANNVDINVMLEANTLFRAKMSRILFKRAQLNRLEICRLTNSSVRRHLF